MDWHLPPSVAAWLGLTGWFVAAWLGLTGWIILVRATSAKARAGTSDAEFGCLILFLLGVLGTIILLVDHVSIDFH